MTSPVCCQAPPYSPLRRSALTVQCRHSVLTDAASSIRLNQYLTWSQLRAYQTTERQSCNGRENSMTDNGRRCSLTIYSARLVDQSVSMRSSEACRLHGGMVAQHTRRVGELKSEGLVDAGQWGKKRQEGFNTLPSSARTPHAEATSRARIAQKASEEQICFLRLPFAT